LIKREGAARVKNFGPCRIWLFRQSIISEHLVRMKIVEAIFDAGGTVAASVRRLGFAELAGIGGLDEGM
jgi:hypothetical protein